MDRRRFSLALSLTALPIAGHAGEVKPFRLLAADLPPFAMEKGEFAPGAMVEICLEIARRLDTPVKPEFYPWQRTISMTQALPRLAIVPLTRTPEREGQYRWLAHLYWQNFVFVAPHGKFDLSDPARLRNKRIAVLRGAPSYRMLAEAGFKHITECASVAECMRMLKAGMVDLNYGGETIRRASIEVLGARESEFDFSPAFRTGEMWAAGTLDFTDAEAAAWQAALKSMRADGSYQRILKKYELPALDR